MIPRKGSLPDKHRSQGHSPGFCRKQKLNHVVRDRKRPEVKKKLHSASPVVWRQGSWKEESRNCSMKGEELLGIYYRDPDGRQAFAEVTCFLTAELCSELGSVTLCCQECLKQEWMELSESSLIYIANSRTARATQKDLISKEKVNKIKSKVIGPVRWLLCVSS